MNDDKASAEREYTTQIGDTIADICERFGITQTDFWRANAENPDIHTWLYWHGVGYVPFVGSRVRLPAEGGVRR